MSTENTKNKNLSSIRKGSALAYALVIMTVVMILLTSIIGYIVAQLKFSANRIEREKAFQVAEAGVYYYRWYLAHATDSMNAQQLKVFWQDDSTLGVSGDYIEDYKDPETGEVIGNYTIHLDPPDSYSTIASITSTGKSLKLSDSERVIRVRFRRPSWSEYMWVIDGFVNFGSDSEVYGKVHSNFGILFNGLAHNIVSSTPARFNDPTHGGSSLDFGVHTEVNPADPAAPAYPWPENTVPNRPDIFEAGRQFPVPEVSFNGVLTDLENMKTEAQSPNGTTINDCTDTGCFFDYESPDDGKRVILKSNGTFDICTVASYHHAAYHPTSYRKNSGSGTCDSCGGNDCTSAYAIPNNGIIFIEGNVWVDGAVNNNRITIAAADLSGTITADIFIGLNNIRYANYDCNNMIGLVAQRNISVIRDCPENFIVDAALLAQSGRVSRASYAFDNKSTLTFNGAIASYLQPYFNHGINGFGVRTYNFDNNLLYCPPPYFPTGTEYSIDLWEEL